MSHSLRASTQQFFLEHFAIVASVTVLLIFTLGWFVLISPTIDAIQASSDVDLLAVEQERDQLSNERDRLRRAEKILDQLTGAEERKLSGVVSSPFNSTQMYQQMDSLADLAGVTFSQLTITPPTSTVDASGTASGATDPATPTPASSSSGLSEVSVQLNVDGLTAYPDLVNFLELVETHLPLLSMNALSYSLEGQSFTARFTAFALDPL